MENQLPSRREIISRILRAPVTKILAYAWVMTLLFMSPALNVVGLISSDLGGVLLLGGVAMAVVWQAKIVKLPLW